MPAQSQLEVVTMIRPFIGMMSILVALLIIGVSIPLIQGKVPMNQLYGVRIPKSFTSEENWYKLNAYGSKVMIVCMAIPLIIFGTSAFFIPFQSTNQLMAAFLTVILGSAGIGIYLIFRFGNTLL
jgi:uncharacterized membrane protein